MGLIEATVYLLRHGETAWSLSGQHTSCSDISLTEKGRQQAKQQAAFFSQIHFDAVLVSPRVRAQETARLAGFPFATTCEDLAEFYYGDYEGLTTAEIRQSAPGWTVWSQPCPGGETLPQVAQRANNVIKLISGYKGNVALVSHGHFLRIFAATWLNEPPHFGAHFMLDTATVSILSHERQIPAIKVWNMKASDSVV